jgi:hypothetical protein
MVYQRLRLHSKEDAQGQWYQLQWHSDPAAAVLLQLPPAIPSSPPIFTLVKPQRGDLAHRLHEELDYAGLQADACYICRHWQPASLRNDDGIPLGRCRWSDAEGALPAVLATQSALSLACEHFQRLEKPQPSALDASQAGFPPLRVPKAAELDPDRLPFWPRLWRRLRRRKSPQPHWADQIVERSGVGAGTEPCFVCQGRLANLGALAVSSPEGDKQTLSVWRCRSCCTTFFNDWTDRWERLESLETEERYYRIAPAEAYAALHIVQATKGGDHPGQRQDRRSQRAQMLALVAGKPPLSHQVRQGR